MLLLTIGTTLGTRLLQPSLLQGRIIAGFFLRRPFPPYCNTYTVIEFWLLQDTDYCRIFQYLDFIPSTALQLYIGLTSVCAHCTYYAKRMCMQTRHKTQTRNKILNYRCVSKLATFFTLL